MMDGWSDISLHPKLYINNHVLFLSFQPVTEGYRNKCEFTVGPGLDGRGKMDISSVWLYMYLSHERDDLHFDVYSSI